MYPFSDEYRRRLHVAIDSIDTRWLRRGALRRGDRRPLAPCVLADHARPARHARGGGAEHKAGRRRRRCHRLDGRAPARKMDAWAGMRGHSSLLNDPGRMKRLKEQNDLAQSLSCIQRAQQHAKKAKKEADVAGLFDKAPFALLKT